MQVIATFPDDSNYVMRTTLDGVAYQLTFRYSERETCYYVDLALDDGTPLVGGFKVVCNISLWRNQRYNPQVPQGSMVALNVTNSSDDPPDIGELGIGRRVQLTYFTPGELAAGAQSANANPNQ